MRKAARAALILGVLNFVAFASGTLIVGGDALNAHSRCARLPGKYYLWDKGLANPCHQVSRGAYLYSELHISSVLLTWPFVMLAGFYEWRRRQFSMRERGVGGDVASSESRIMAIGLGFAVVYFLACIIVLFRAVFR